MISCLSRSPDLEDYFLLKFGRSTFRGNSMPPTSPFYAEDGAVRSS
jgi:hypothetical protein